MNYLVEFLTGFDHLLLLLLTLIGLTHHELLDLLKLMHAEDATDIAAGAARLLAEAGGDPGVANGEVRGLVGLVEVHGAERLFAGGDQEHVVLRLLRVVDDAVQGLLIILELRHLAHHVLLHEVGGLHRGVAPLVQERDGVVDQGLVEEDAWAGEVVAAMAGGVATRLHVESANHVQDLVVWAEAVGLELILGDAEAGVVVAVGAGAHPAEEILLLRLPVGDGLIACVLVIADGYGVVYDVADEMQFVITGLEELIQQNEKSHGIYC